MNYQYDSDTVKMYKAMKLMKDFILKNKLIFSHFCAFMMNTIDTDDDMQKLDDFLKRWK